MRLQLLHFYSVFKTSPTLQDLTSVFTLRKRRWCQRNFGDNRHSVNKEKICLKKNKRTAKKYFHCLPTLALPSNALDLSNSNCYSTESTTTKKHDFILWYKGVPIFLRNCTKQVLSKKHRSFLKEFPNRHKKETKLSEKVNFTQSLVYGS